MAKKTQSVNDLLNASQKQMAELVANARAQKTQLIEVDPKIALQEDWKKGIADIRNAPSAPKDTTVQEIVNPVINPSVPSDYLPSSTPSDGTAAPPQDNVTAARVAAATDPKAVQEANTAAAVAENSRKSNFVTMQELQAAQNVTNAKADEGVPPALQPPPENVGASSGMKVLAPQSMDAVKGGAEIGAGIVRKTDELMKKAQEDMANAAAASQAALSYEIDNKARIAQIDAEKNAQVALAMDEYAKNVKAIQETTQIKVAEQQRKLDGYIEDFTKTRVDPNYWRDKSAAAQVAGAIAIAMGTYASAMGAGPNVALKIIDDAIARDLDAQQAEVARKGQLVNMQTNQVAQAMQLGLNELQARNLVHAATLEAVKGQFAAQLSTYSANKGVLLEGMQSMNTLEAGALQTRAKLHMDTADSIYKQQGLVLAANNQKMSMQLAAMEYAAKLAKSGVQPVSQAWGVPNVVKDPVTGQERYQNSDFNDPEQAAKINSKVADTYAMAAGAYRVIADMVAFSKTDRNRSDYAQKVQEYRMAVKQYMLSNWGSFDDGVREAIEKVAPGGYTDRFTDFNKIEWDRLPGVVGREVHRQLMGRFEAVGYSAGLNQQTRQMLDFLASGGGNG